jgi:enoyl-CoA hydratase/carnithine racemase
VRQLRKPIFAAVNGIAWDLMRAARRIADKIASNSPTAVQSVKRAVHLGGGQPIEQAIVIMMDAHWRSAVQPDRVELLGLRWVRQTGRQDRSRRPTRLPLASAATRSNGSVLQCNLVARLWARVASW